jgi:hypothetical protein
MLYSCFCSNEMDGCAYEWLYACGVDPDRELERTESIGFRDLQTSNVDDINAKTTRNDVGLHTTNDSTVRLRHHGLAYTVSNGTANNRNDSTPMPTR